MFKRNGIIISLLHTLLMNQACADMVKAAAEANAVIEATGNYHPTDVGNVPGYTGTNVPETNYNENNIESEKYKIAAKDDTFALIKESIEKRPPYEIDIIKDPMFLASNEALSGLEDAKDPGEKQSKPTRHTCTRGQEAYQSKCKRIFVPHQSGTKTETKEWTINLSRRRMYWNDYIAFQPSELLKKHYLGALPTQSQLIDTFKRVFTGKDEVTGEKIDIDPTSIISINLVKMYGSDVPLINNEADHRGHPILGAQYHQVSVQSKTEVPVFDLIWEESCPQLENLIDTGKCEVQTKICIGGSQTKVIEGVSIIADCWEEEVTYQCHTEEKNTCKPLLEKGCIQTNSVCKTKDGEDCIEWEQTFECYDKQSLATSKINTDYPCLNGDCVDQSWEPNTDMADSLSKLAIFKEMQKDMDAESQTVFKGQDLQCSRVVAGAKNCCVQRGWGMKVGLAACNSDEKLLAKQRQENKCIQVGTYCAEKALGKCIRKKTSFCCYASKLSRIMNEQAVKQLGLSLGSPEHPRCSVLTLTNFTKIDFSKIDFSELFQDITTKTKLPDASLITKGIQSSMDDNKRLLTDKKNKVTQGRSHENF